MPTGPWALPPAQRPRSPATLLPVLPPTKALETTHLPRVAGRTSGRTALVTTHQSRTPHHTISAVSLIGGRQVPLPGEVAKRARPTCRC